jgi:MoaA/NifB/PqqE/SkfB family radical SAM enzyme
MSNPISSIIDATFNNRSPDSVIINLTSACQSSCIYCEIGQTHYKNEKTLLNYDDLIWVVDEMKNGGIKKLILGGGEPLLFPTIFKVIDYANNFNIRCYILTNGFLLPRLTPDEIAVLKKCNTSISISIDSFDEKLEDFLRGAKCSLESPLQGIGILNENEIPIGMLTVVSKYNYKELYDMVVKAYELGIKSVSFAPVSFASNFPDVTAVQDKIDLNIGKDDLSDVKLQLERILKFEKHNEIVTNASTLSDWLPHYIKWIPEKREKPFFESFIKRFWCKNLGSTITINYYGDVLPCLLLNPTRSIKNPGGKNLRELHRQSYFPIVSAIQRRNYPEECKSCICQVQVNQFYSTLKYPISNYRLVPPLLRRIAGRVIDKVTGAIFPSKG